jgi:hypothetical protein
MFSVLNDKSHWNQILNIAYKQDCVGELLFWKSNILKLEPQSLLQKSSSYNLCADASNSAAAGFIENFDLVRQISILFFLQELNIVKAKTCHSGTRLPFKVMRAVF